MSASVYLLVVDEFVIGPIRPASRGLVVFSPGKTLTAAGTDFGRVSGILSMDTPSRLATTIAVIKHPGGEACRRIRQSIQCPRARCHNLCVGASLRKQHRELLVSAASVGGEADGGGSPA